MAGNVSQTANKASQENLPGYARSAYHTERYRGGGATACGLRCAVSSFGMGRQRHTAHENSSLGWSSEGPWSLWPKRMQHSLATDVTSRIPYRTSRVFTTHHVLPNMPAHEQGLPICQIAQLSTLQTKGSLAVLAPCWWLGCSAMGTADSISYRWWSCSSTVGEYCSV